MRQVEIAKVQLRKFTQQGQDLLQLLHDDCRDLLSPSTVDGLAGCLADTTWIVGHGYELAEEQIDGEAGAILETKEDRPRLLLHFLGRTQVPPLGGYAADIYREADGEWQRITGLADWTPSQWAQIECLWEEPPEQA